MNFNNNIGLAKKIKLIVAYIAVAISLGYLLVGFEIQGWYQAIDLTTQLFNKPADEVQVTAPHAKESINNLIRWNFGKDAELATKIFRAESGLRCDAVSKTADYGLAQINIKAHPQYTIAQLLDCKTNIEAAAKIYKRQGFTPWVAYKTGAYKNL